MRDLKPILVSLIVGGQNKKLLAGWAEVERAEGGDLLAGSYQAQAQGATWQVQVLILVLNWLSLLYTVWNREGVTSLYRIRA